MLLDHGTSENAVLCVECWSFVTCGNEQKKKFPMKRKEKLNENVVVTFEKQRKASWWVLIVRFVSLHVCLPITLWKLFISSYNERNKQRSLNKRRLPYLELLMKRRLGKGHQSRFLVFHFPPRDDRRARYIVEACRFISFNGQNWIFPGIWDGNCNH